mgnify:CR=1 FL=1
MLVTIDLQRIKIRPTDILQQYRSPRHQIRNTVVQLIHIKERIAAHIHQFTLAMLSLLTVLNRSHAMLAGSYNLYILLIREGISEMRHRENAMLHRRGGQGGRKNIENLPSEAVSGVTDNSS